MSAPYCLYEEHADDFLRDYPDADREALVIAVIVGGNLNEMKNAPFDDSLMERVSCIYNGAICLASGGNYWEDNPHYRESLFLAHIIKDEDLQELRSSLKNYLPDMLPQIPREKLNPAENFICRDTTIGERLSARIDYIRQKIEEMEQEKLEAERKAAVPVRPALRLVPKDLEP